jgi:TRAP-type C4-dicarboxylate transport system substrate-binding protein
MSIHQLTIKVPAAAALGALVLAGCSDASADRAGGESVTSRVLTFAQPNDNPGPVLTLWADEVKKASEGTLEIEFQNLWHGGELDYEAQTIADVTDGEVDMAWVGARAFDTVGVTSFQALIAPLLVDSHELQAAVFAAGIPDEMLGGLDDLGLVGVGALPGPLFKILGKSGAYVTPDDYAGDVIGIQASELHTRVFETLGAATELMPTGADISGVDGYVQQLGSIMGNHYEFVADYVTANVNLWPRPLILFANAEVYESLDESQQDALATASAAAVGGARGALDTEESDGGSGLCSGGMQFPAASDDQLAELRGALDPVYEQLAADSETSKFLDAIQEIKDDLGAAPHTVDCATAAEQSEASEVDGVYMQTRTWQDFIDAGIELGCDSSIPPELAEIPPNVVVILRLTLEDGRLEQLESFDGGEFEPGFIGSYEVFRDWIELADSMGRFTTHWTFDGTNLVLSDMEGGECGDEIVWTTHPWIRVDE